MSVATDKRDTIDTAPAGSGLPRASRDALRAYTLEHCSMKPATVVAYTAATQIATCTIGFLRVPIAEAGAPEVPLPPELVDARVAVLQGGSHSDHVPILPGDTGILIFADRALDLWYRQGGAPVDPVHPRAHAQADAVFIPGLAPDARRSAPPSPALAAARVIDAPHVALGAAAVPGVDNVAIASLVHTYLTAMITAAPVVALDGGASFKAALIAYLAANPPTAFAAEKVSAQ